MLPYEEKVIMFNKSFWLKLPNILGYMFWYCFDINKSIFGEFSVFC